MSDSSVGEVARASASAGRASAGADGGTGAAAGGGTGAVAGGGTNAVAGANLWTSGRIARLVAAIAAMVLCSVRIWIQCGNVFPAMREVFPLVVDMQTLTSMAAYGLIAYVAWRAPRLVRPIGIGVMTGIAAVAGTALMILGLSWQNQAITVVGAVLAYSVGGTWPIIMVGITLCALGNRRDLVTAAVCGEAIGAALRCVITDMSLPVAVIAVGIVTVILILVVHIYGVPFLRKAHTQVTVARLVTTNPDSFLTPGHKLVILVALFEFLHAIVLAERFTIFSLASTLITAVVICAGGVWLLAHRARSTEDVLLYGATLMMLASFLLRPATTGETMVSDVLAIAGASFAWMLLWISMASVGMANPTGALWSLSICYVMQAAAIGAGSFAVGLANSLGGSGAQSFWLSAVNAIAATALVGYVMVGLRKFSFTEAFRSIRPAIELDAVDALYSPDARRASVEDIRRSCAEIAQRYGLTERELEVLELLACGKSGPQIQQQLVISQNTAKTHVRHIYRKLDVHSQREVIELVRSAAGR